MKAVLTVGLVLVFSLQASAAVPEVKKFARHEVMLRATGEYRNPYTGLSAEAELTPPGGDESVSVPLFWDGGATWTFRFSPDRIGEWKWRVTSADSGLNGRTGSFRVIESDNKGAIRPTRGHPHHFERQDGSAFWFLGDTGWALYTDSNEEKHNREAAMAYLKTRSEQGFNVVHSMLLSEAGWGNRGGAPFKDLPAEEINPEYWKEVDLRLGYANELGIVCGLTLAWGDKRKVEPYAWRKFPSLEARKRYARYIAARYSAYDVYFIVSGEWHAEIRTRGETTEEAVRREFIEIGDVVSAADPHDRMLAIHPMTSHGSVREFNAASWMSFGDYQQNYRQLHERILESRRFDKPVVNSEYGYHLRDQSGDGVPDKDNSTRLESMRYATWDIVMAGGYVVTGFGTTYFGGNRDPGPFDLGAKQNDGWEEQIGIVKRLFTSLEFWKLEPHDELVNSSTPRGGDTRHLNQIAPPDVTYWCLAEPGKQHVVYVRGTVEPVRVKVSAGSRSMRAQQWNLRTGETKELDAHPVGGTFDYRAPDDQDWVVVLKW